MKLTFVALLGLLFLTAGCAHSQAPVTPPPVVDVSWPVPTGQVSGALYLVSRATVANGIAACPAVTGTAYMVLTATGLSAPAYTDTAPPTGQSACYTVQAQTANPTQTSPASPPSNSGVPLPVPSSPLAPASSTASVATGTVANNVQPKPVNWNCDTCSTSVVPSNVVASVRY